MNAICLCIWRKEGENETNPAVRFITFATGTAFCSGENVMTPVTKEQKNGNQADSHVHGENGQSSFVQLVNQLRPAEGRSR